MVGARGKRLAFIVFLAVASAAPAHAASYCSNGYGNKPARLTKIKGSADYELKLDGKPAEHLTSAGSVGTGLNGVVYSSGKDRTDVMYHVELWTDANQQPEVTVGLILFRDRVFTPCDR